MKMMFTTSAIDLISDVNVAIYEHSRRQSERDLPTTLPSSQRMIPLLQNPIIIPLHLTANLETLSLHFHLIHWWITKQWVPPRGQNSLLQVKRGEEITVVVDRRYNQRYQIPLKVTGCHSSQVVDDSSTMQGILALNHIEKKMSLGESWRSRSLGWPP